MALAEGQRINRREFMAVALGLTAGIAGKSLVDKYTPVFATGTREKDLFAESEHSLLLVTQGVNLRTEPLIPARSRIYQRDNTISWGNIVAVNQVPLGNKDDFVILNSLIVYGQEVDPGWYRSNRWGTVNVTKRDNSIQTAYFSTVSEHVRSLWDYMPDKATSSFPRIIPVSKETAAREVFPSIWANDIRAKFNGEIPLEAEYPYSPGEVIYDNVTVVPAGISEADRIQNANTPVNIRNFPDTSYSNREPVKILGQIAMGSNIKNLLLTRGRWWGAFRLSDVDGEILGANTANLDPDTICAVYSDYLLTTDGIKSIPQTQR